MEEKNKKRQIAKKSVLITSIFVIFMSITYAFVSQVLTGTKEVVINAGVLDLVLEEENAITISNALPMYDAVGMIQEDVFVFRLVNKTSNPTNYILKLSKIASASELSTSDVKYYLTKEGVGEPKLLSSLQEDGTVDSGTIAGNDTIDYTLRLWINSTVTDENAIAGKTLSYRIDAEAGQEIAKISLVEQLELENIVEESTDTFPNFAAISSASNGRGIYKYQEDGQDIYYWRGKVDEIEGAANHIIFAGYCWEMVRTTKTGGIKMIYDGTPVEVDGVKTCPNTGTASQLANSSPFNSKYNDNAYAGYMYGLTGLTTEPASPQCIKLNSTRTAAEVGGESTKEECLANNGKWATTAYEATHANVVNSDIKKVIDSWFETSNLNTKSILRKIEDAVYCNDRKIDVNAEETYTILGYGRNRTSYMGRNRLELNRQPSLECSQENDRFTVNSENGNGDLTYPVGLLTVDEIMLAGGIFGMANNDYYLHTGEGYSTLSICDYNSDYNIDNIIHYCVRGNGQFDWAYSRSPVNGIRPVITLSSNVEITGVGTESSPYIAK